ncbi:type II toxin-antitoxin system VapC family toxin [Agrobacterium tumefaciens]|uniref:type II toxin-antitoxin system VapC family toxin n=1 Tax=Agrobacterium tumefaciens TaxID=358 RepID=UPI0015738938|nr:type II toxin-antitoxin system VapC family toxin [Agrobacterium tumefaciens]MCZ7497254.1 type II toxin-antitoxin system VapC family toxin [Rhizobium rhizogenes]NTE56471.1 type II toxin-antitoxin system VapC family toxin [Agrobacterium tumefaciens]NTE74439.1 type II toxin-antitoxin system VapC family toxin [Agrobacterium tumefaciens]
MYLDASAIISVLTREEDAAYLIAKLERATKPIHCSSMTVFEAVISLARRITNEQHGDQSPIPPAVIDEAQAHVDALLQALRVREMAISGTTHRKAIEAARTFGKFVAHPARLNMGDCFVYACAKEYRLPLLFKGDDFSRTDIEIA